MPKVFEHAEQDLLAPGETDGMADFMAELDEPTSTDWDVMVENPPHAGLEGEIMPHPDLVKNLPAG